MGITFLSAFFSGHQCLPLAYSENDNSSRKKKKKRSLLLFPTFCFLPPLYIKQTMKIISQCYLHWPISCYPHETKTRLGPDKQMSSYSFPLTAELGSQVSEWIRHGQAALSYGEEDTDKQMGWLAQMGRTILSITRETYGKHCHMETEVILGQNITWSRPCMTHKTLYTREKANGSVSWQMAWANYAARKGSRNWESGRYVTQWKQMTPNYEWLAEQSYFSLVACANVSRALLHSWTQTDVSTITLRLHHLVHHLLITGVWTTWSISLLLPQENSKIDLFELYFRKILQALAKDKWLASTLRKSELHLNCKEYTCLTCLPISQALPKLKREKQVFSGPVSRFVINSAEEPLARVASRDPTQLQVLSCQSNLDSQCQC